MHIRAEFADGFVFVKEYQLNRSCTIDFDTLIEKHGAIIWLSIDY